MIDISNISLLKRGTHHKMQHWINKKNKPGHATTGLSLCCGLLSLNSPAITHPHSVQHRLVKQFIALSEGG